MQFHLRFNEPSDVWPQGSWALYQITGDEIAKRVEFGPDGNAVRRDSWPGYIATYSTIEGAAAVMRRLANVDAALTERERARQEREEKFKREKHENAKARARAKHLIVGTGITFDPMNFGRNVWPSEQELKGKDDPYEGDHFAADWIETLEMVKTYVEMAK